MSNVQSEPEDNGFEEYWEQFNNIDVLKALAKEIWDDAFKAGGKKPWFSLTKEQMKAIQNMDFKE